MLIGVPKETWPGERRVALVPSTVKKLKSAGFEVTVESGCGTSAGFPDSAFEEAGATVAEGRESLLASADIVLRVRKPSGDEVTVLKSGALHVSFLDPFNERALVQKLAAQGVTAVSMEMIPRSTRAQKMDALSSQANLAGYVTVIQAAYHAPRILPMMMTPAGTIAPARVFVIGAGVAGLQAIATAKRLGARVEAFDTRPVVAEQVQSLGAKFVQDRPRRHRPDRAGVRQGIDCRAAREAEGRAEEGHCPVRYRHHHGSGVRPAGPADRFRGHGACHAAWQRGGGHGGGDGG